MAIKRSPTTGNILRGRNQIPVVSCLPRDQWIRAKRCPEDTGDYVDLWRPAGLALPYNFQLDSAAAAPLGIDPGCFFIKPNHTRQNEPGTVLTGDAPAGACTCRWIQAKACCPQDGVNRPVPIWFALVDAGHILLKNGDVVPLPYVFRTTPVSPEAPCAAPCFYVYPDNPTTDTYPGEPPTVYAVSTCTDIVRCTCTGLVKVFECCSRQVVAYATLSDALDFFDANNTTGFQAPNGGTCFYFTLDGICPPAYPIIDPNDYTPNAGAAHLSCDSGCPSCCTPREIPTYCGDDPGQPTTVFANFDKLLVINGCPALTNWDDAPPGTPEWGQELNLTGISCGWAGLNTGLAVNGKAFANASIIRTTCLLAEDCPPGLQYKCYWDLDISLYSGGIAKTLFHGYRTSGHTPLGTYSPWPFGGPFCLPSVEVI